VCLAVSPETSAAERTYGAAPPLDSFFAVPPDPQDATRWDVDMMQRGIAACMERNGFEYRVLTSDQSQAGVDSNVAIMGALGDRAE
jgi:hypothetical protein